MPKVNLISFTTGIEELTADFSINGRCILTVDYQRGGFSFLVKGRLGNAFVDSCMLKLRHDDV